jgi:hypothetical protein
MSGQKKYFKRRHFIVRSISFAYLLICAFQFSFSQTDPVIKSGVDTTSIRIGEQILFTVTVEADTTAQVIFPEDQTFSPLEMVEAFKTDTTRSNSRITLLKTYALTQFDSGVYLLPKQWIEVDGKGYFTDSMFVSVATIPVDTVSKKFFDIKPMAETSGGLGLWGTVLLWLILLGFIGGSAYYWFFVHKKKLTPEQQEALLPPFERALKELKRLEESRYLIQDEFKEYYSELTGIVRSYLEEEVQISALESTTAQLIEKLELLKDAGQLNLDPETLKQFRRILETADLVKFAKSKPELGAAERDRKEVESIVIKTHEAIPEPTEEELAEMEANQAAFKAKRRRKRIKITALSLAGTIVLAFVLTVGIFGWERVRESVLGSPTKSLLEGEWVISTYGFPPVTLETPDVLYRKDLELPVELRDSISSLTGFQYNNTKAKISIGLSITVLNNMQKEPDFAQSVEDVLLAMEQAGARNIITKQEEFTTNSGVKGVKVFGTARLPISGSAQIIDGEYNILLFGGKGFIQQAFISWERGDTYSESIVSRILQSLEVNTVL